MLVHNVVAGSTDEVDGESFLDSSAFVAWVETTYGVPANAQLLLDATSANIKARPLLSAGEVYVYDQRLTRDFVVQESERADTARLLSALSQSWPGPDSETPLAPASSHQSLSAWFSKYLDAVTLFETTLAQLHGQVTVVCTAATVALNYMRDRREGLDRPVAACRATLDQIQTATGVGRDQILQAHQNLKRFTGFVDVEAGTGCLYDLVPESQLVALTEDMESRAIKVKPAIEHLERDVPQLQTKSQALEQAINQWTREAHDQLQAQSSDKLIAEAKQLAMQRSPGRVPDLSTMLSPLHRLTAVLDLALAVKRQCQLRCYTDFMRGVGDLIAHTARVRSDLAAARAELVAADQCRRDVNLILDMPALFGASLLEHVRQATWSKIVRQTTRVESERLAQVTRAEFKARRLHFETAQHKIFKLTGVDPNALAVQPREPVLDVSFMDQTLDAEPYEAKFHELLDIVMDLHYDATYTELLEKHEKNRQALEELRVSLTKTTSRSTTVSDSVRSETARPVSPASPARRFFKSSNVSSSSINGSASASASASAADTNPNTKALQQRIAKLEGILHRYEVAEMNGRRGTETAAERLALSEAQRAKAEARVKTLEAQISVCEASVRDAERIKSDLLANLAATESDFVRERRTLLQEISELKLRVEVLEEQESTEIEKTRAELEPEVLRLRKQIESLNLRNHEEAHSYTQELDKFMEEKHGLMQQNNRVQAKADSMEQKAHQLSELLALAYTRTCEILECMGLQAQKVVQDGSVVSFDINRVKGLSRRRIREVKVSRGEGAALETDEAAAGDDVRSLELIKAPENETSGASALSAGSTNGNMLPPLEVPPSDWSDDAGFTDFISSVFLDYELLRDTMSKRFKDVEHLARKLQRESKQLKDRIRICEKEGRDKVSLRGFRQGDMVLFLPTRDHTQTHIPWAAFNVGAPHYFLEPAQAAQLASREWLVARIKTIVERVVAPGSENPFELSDGLKWFMIEAEDYR